MEKLYHINEASKLLGLTEKELNDLVEGKKIPHVVKNLSKMIKQSTIAEILINRVGDIDIEGGVAIEYVDPIDPIENPNYYNQNAIIDGVFTVVDKDNPAHFILPIKATLGEGNKIENLTWVNPDKTK